MSVTKMLSRIVTPEDPGANKIQEQISAESLHALSYGIANDPLAQFACVIAALIHGTSLFSPSNSINFSS
jgi:hypothetical protein